MDDQVDSVVDAAHRSNDELTSIHSPDQKSDLRDVGHEALENIAAAVDTVKEKFHLHHVHATGPSKLFNPTNVRFHVHWGSDNDGNDSPSTNAASKELTALQWRSRDNRKGRNSSVVPPVLSAKSHRRLENTKSHLIEFFRNIGRMCTTFPYWDMAFWSGWSYSIGSILFVIDGAWAWGPLAYPSTEFKGETKYGVPLCFFIGALFYQIGATMAYLEAVNDGSFAGSAMKRLLEGHAEDQKKMLDEHLHAFFGHMKLHHSKDKDEENAEQLANSVDPDAGWNTKERHERPGSIYPDGKAPASRRGGMDLGPAEEGDVSEYLAWRWWPTWHALRTHHLREIGYVACAIQLFGATLYGITGIVVLPGILSSLAPWQELAAYWIPQIVASSCFLSAGILFTFETQEKWFRPEFENIGWWIGAWATVGSVGFLLCAAFGIASDSSTGAEYQSSLSSMWGSAAYLISSLLQWYESVNKGPVLAFPNSPVRPGRV